MFYYLALSFFILLQASPIPLESDKPDASDSSAKYIFSDAFNSMVSVLKSNEENSFYSALEEFIDLEPNELKALIKSQGKVDFLMAKNRFSITEFTLKMQKSVLFTGKDKFSRPVFIKIFSENELDQYHREIKVLQSSKSDILIAASHSPGSRGIFESLFLKKGKVSEPYILILKHTLGTPFSDVIHDFNVGRYLVDHPQDKSYIDSLWPDFRKFSMEEFTSLYAIYLKDKFRVKIGELYYVHPELDPEKVILTPKNEMVVIDYGDLELVPKGYREKKLQHANAQEKLIDLFEKFSKTVRAEINIEILKLKIPDEILFNPNFDSSVSQMDTSSHMEDESINSVNDPLVKASKEENTDGDSSEVGHSELIHEKKKPRRRSDRPVLSDSKEILETLNEESTTHNPSDSQSADEAVTVLAGSKKPSVIDDGHENYESSEHSFSLSDDDSNLILEANDDYDIDDLPFRSGILKDLKSFGSELTESFYSTSSTPDEAWLSGVAEEESTPAIRNSFSSSDLPRIKPESEILQSWRRVRSFMNNRPVSPIPQSALKLDLIRSA